MLALGRRACCRVVVSSLLHPGRSGEIHDQTGYKQGDVHQGVRGAYWLLGARPAGRHGGALEWHTIDLCATADEDDKLLGDGSRAGLVQPVLAVQTWVRRTRRSKTESYAAVVLDLGFAEALGYRFTGGRAARPAGCGCQC